VWIVSEILDLAHDMAKALHEVGAMETITLRSIERLRLPQPRQFAAEDIRRIRQASAMSQAVFAAMIGVVTNTVAQWEQGHKKPSGASARLLDVIDRKGIAAIV
jgi:putative transcriptional regulator